MEHKKREHPTIDDVTSIPYDRPFEKMDNQTRRAFIERHIQNLHAISDFYDKPLLLTVPCPREDGEVFARNEICSTQEFGFGFAMWLLDTFIRDDSEHAPTVTTPGECPPLTDTDAPHSTSKNENQ